MFSKYLYIKIYKNAFELLLLNHEASSVKYTPNMPFTTTRLLVGNFNTAVDCLRKAIKETLNNKWGLNTAVILMHPMEMSEGGLSEVEERILMELALASGARKVKIHVGPELSKAEALEHLKKA